MKKYLIAIIILAALALGGCVSINVTEPTHTSQETTVVKPSESTEEKSLSDIIDEIYEIKDPGLKVGNISVDITDKDSVKYFTGLTDLSKVKDILVSEAMIGSQAYSLVLVQVNNEKDSSSVGDEMLNGIDQRKWICVEADDIQVTSQGDVILLIMVSSTMKDTVTSQEIVNAFEQVL